MKQGMADYGMDGAADWLQTIIDTVARHIFFPFSFPFSFSFSFPFLVLFLVLVPILVPVLAVVLSFHSRFSSVVHVLIPFSFPNLYV
jgi:hypothetical protein